MSTINQIKDFSNLSRMKRNRTAREAGIEKFGYYVNILSPYMASELDVEIDAAEKMAATIAYAVLAIGGNIRPTILATFPALATGHKVAYCLTTAEETIKMCRALQTGENVVY